MAKAKKCDRCGAYFDSNKTYPQCLDFYNLCIVYNPKWENDTCYMDICDKCGKELVEWLQDGWPIEED